MAVSSEEVFIQASFYTNEKRNIVKDTSFSLPLSATRDDLTQLLCQLITERTKHEETCVKKEFDFLINSTLLRKTLGDLIKDLSLTTENVIEIEYIERNPPPLLDQEFPHNDWVSAVHCNDQYILSGCYDYCVRLWKHSGDLVVKCPGHEREITDVAWLPQSLSHDKEIIFLSSSHDQHVHIWKLNYETDEVILVHICKGHSRSVEAIAVSPTGEKFCSGGYDKHLKIWSSALDDETSNEEIEEESLAKRSRSLSNQAPKPTSRVPIATLAGHTHPITCIVWTDETEFFSAGYDHCIRMWDVPTGVNKNTLNGSKVFLDIDKKGDVLVSGHTDRHVRIWDTRTSASVVVTCTLTSHHGWVKRTRWSPTSEHQLVSGCYDNTAKLWDIRSTKVPLYTIAAHEDKLLCLDWSLPQVIVTGGADNTMRTYSLKK